MKAMSSAGSMTMTYDMSNISVLCAQDRFRNALQQAMWACTPANSTILEMNATLAKQMSSQLGMMQATCKNSSPTDRLAATVVVTGSLSMTVSNPAAFVKDPAAVTGVKQALATLSSQPVNQIDVNLSAPSGGRRLASSMPRQLQTSGSVKADFAITASAASTSAASALGNLITGNLTAASLSASIQNALSSTNYSVTVQSVSASAVVMAADGSVVTTTTAAMSAKQSFAWRVSQSFTWVLTGFALAATM